MNFVKNLIQKGFLKRVEKDNRIFYHLSTPCRFIINKEVVNELKDKYVSDEEIGGVLWATPEIVNSEKIYIVKKVSFIRNDIEDSPFYDKDEKLRTKKDTYRPDKNDLFKELNEVIAWNNLPVKFHTHPTKGENIIDNLSIQLLQTETSDQDRIESSVCHRVGDFDLLMPRGLIVGNKDLGKEIFIGLYNGFIAPVEFEGSKEKVIDEKMEKIETFFSEKTFTNDQIVLLGIGAVLLLAVVLKYPKYSLPTIAALGFTAYASLTNTSNSENPSYFNKLSFGDANIYIP